MRGAPAPPAGKVPPQPQTPRFPRSKRARSSPNPTRLLHPPLRTRRAPAPPTSATTGRPRNRLSPSPSAAPSEEDARANPPEKGRRSPNPTRLLRPLFRTPKAGAEQSLPLPRVHPPPRLHPLPPWLLIIKESRTAAPPPPRSFPRSSVPLPAIAPAGIGVAQTGIPVIPRNAQSAIFAPSDPSPDIRIPWQTSSNA